MSLPLRNPCNTPPGFQSRRTINGTALVYARRFSPRREAALYLLPGLASHTTQGTSAQTMVCAPLAGLSTGGVALAGLSIRFVLVSGGYP